MHTTQAMHCMVPKTTQTQKINISLITNIDILQTNQSILNCVFVISKLLVTLCRRLQILIDAHASCRHCWVGRNLFVKVSVIAYKSFLFFSEGGYYVQICFVISTYLLFSSICSLCITVYNIHYHKINEINIIQQKQLLYVLYTFILTYAFFLSCI